MPQNDPIAEFMALPEAKQLDMLRQLPRANQDRLLAAVKVRRQQLAPRPLALRTSQLPQIGPAPRRLAITPANMSDAERVRRSGIDPSSVANRYGPGVGGYIEDARQHVERFLDRNAPAIFGTVGGMATGGLAAPLGLLAGTAAGVVGAAAGGAAGAPDGQHGKEALKQGSFELGGRLLAPIAARVVSPAMRAVSPWLERYPVIRELAAHATGPSKKAAKYLTAAAGPEAYEPLGRALGDIEAEMQRLPQGKRTVQDFLDAVNGAKDRMNAEYGAAVFPIANHEIYPSTVIDRLQALITPNLDKTVEGRAEKAAIRKAIIEFQQPWRIGELDAERMATQARLNRFHRLGDVAQYTAKKASRNVDIDNAIEQGLKDALYPIADRAAGKTSGYFANMKMRQANLIQLQEILDKRIKDLAGKTAQIAGSPRFSSENLSVSMHAGGTPRLGLYSLRNVIRKPNPLAAASRRVAKAFPRDRVSALPYQVLLTNLARAVDIATGAPAPRKQELEQHPTDAYQGVQP